MIRARSRMARLALAIAASITGGSVFSACETRLKDALVEGSTQFLYGLLDPSADHWNWPSLDDEAEE